MKLAILLGLLIAALALHPAAASAAAPAARWLAAQPLIWGFLAGAVTRPHLGRRLRAIGGAR